MLKKRVAIQDFAAETRLFNHRAVVAMLIVVLMFCVIIFNQYQLQVVSYQDYQTRSEGNRIKVVPMAPNRGLIYDRTGILLAENKPVFSLELVPEQISDMAGTLEKLASLIEISDEQKDSFLKQVKAQRRFNSIALKEQLNDTEVAILAANQHLFPGVTVEARLSRNYPFGDLFTHALGYIGKINTRELQQLDADGEAANFTSILVENCTVKYTNNCFMRGNRAAANAHKKNTTAQPNPLINNINKLSSGANVIKMDKKQYDIIMTYYDFQMIYCKLVLGIIIAAKISL